MKKVLLFSLFLSMAFSLSAINPIGQGSDLDHVPEVQELGSVISGLTADQFLALTPQKYKELTGEKLGFKNTLKLKAAQKLVKNNGAEDIEKGLYIVLAIFGLGWLAMGLMDDWQGNNWVINLVLAVLTCGLGSIIHSFIKMKEYYS